MCSTITFENELTIKLCKMYVKVQICYHKGRKCTKYETNVSLQMFHVRMYIKTHAVILGYFYKK